MAFNLVPFCQAVLIFKVSGSIRNKDDIPKLLTVYNSHRFIYDLHSMNDGGEFKTIVIFIRMN